MKRFKTLMKNDKGFTLVELIIVIAILAIVLGIAVPNLLDSINKSRIKTDVTNAKLIANATVQTLAVDENLATYTVTRLNMSVRPIATGDEQDFFDQVLGKLQGMPSPRNESSEVFLLTVESGDVTIEVGSVDGSSSTELYPKPSNPYDIK